MMYCFHGENSYGWTMENTFICAMYAKVMYEENKNAKSKPPPNYMGEGNRNT